MSNEKNEFEVDFILLGNPLIDFAVESLWNLQHKNERLALLQKHQSRKTS